MPTRSKPAHVFAICMAAAVMAFGQAKLPATVPPQPSLEPHSTEVITSGCAAISARDSQLAPLTRLCEFAQSYRSSLPNFICKQETVSRAAWYGGPPTTSIEALVTYQDGYSVYSEVKVNGKPQASDDWQNVDVMFKTAGEFGNELIDLFRLPIVSEFHFKRSVKLPEANALEFAFHVPPERNTYWSATDHRRTIFPEFGGSVSLDARSGRLLRMELYPMNLPKDFEIESADMRTVYREVNLGEAGVHLLPVWAESRGCFRKPRAAVQDRCLHNTLQFSGCRKFAGKARILDLPR